ncbi:MAG TPA: hypothetical protein ENH00_05775 [Actinobacteria bacterium]|nr:hypothetical protein BMS3Bbin01_01747 [bacterium BMS3Bbin01]HDH25686.1 hypothetical protein [Actinomycetota bacterium]
MRERESIVLERTGTRRAVRRDVVTALLGGLAVLLAGVIGVFGPTGLPPLRLVALVALVLLALGLTAGALWPITGAVVLLVVEWAVGLAAGSIVSEWTPRLAVGLYLLIESGVTVLERRGIVEAPGEPAWGRIAGVAVTSLVVWTVAALIVQLSRFDVSAGALTQIAGSAAAAAVVATLSWLLRKRM